MKDELIEENPRPSLDELAALPERIRKYIATLEREIDALKSANRSTSDRLRKANWGNWSR